MMTKPVHPSFVRDLEAYSAALLRRESLLIRLEAKRRATAQSPTNGRQQA